MADSRPHRSGNPNTPEYFDELFRGLVDTGGGTVEYEYEDSTRALWYSRVAALPFFETRGRLLDVGCGSGGLFGALACGDQFEKYGIDFSEVAIEVIRSRIDGEFVVGDVHTMPYEDAFFDRIACTQTLEHVDEPQKLIAEMRRVLAPDGLLLITVPEASLDLRPEEWPGGVSMHVNKVSIESLSEMLVSAGLQVESVEIDEREIWMIASPAARQSAVALSTKDTKTVLERRAGPPSCVFLNTYYADFLTHHYCEHPELADASYSDQKDALQSTFFGDSDFYSRGLALAGWRAEDLVVNCAQLQEAWARENDFRDQGLDIAIEQIRRAEPDVVYIQDTSLATSGFIERLRPLARLIVGQIATPVPPQAHLKGFDIIVSSFPHFVERFRAQGITAYYQPLAFDPRVLETIGHSKTRHDLTFIGGIAPSVHQDRLMMLTFLAGILPMEFWGYGRDSLPADSPIGAAHHGDSWSRHMFGTLADSRITFNIHGEVSENYANNMRLFEATGCGAMLVTDYKDNLSDLFEIGREIVAYRSPDECVALIAYYLANPEEATAIALAGQARTLRDHTYSLRMEQTAEILARHLRYVHERDLFPAFDLASISTGYASIDSNEVTEAMTAAWQSPDIPERQRALVQTELAAMYRGEPTPVFQTLATALDSAIPPGGTVLEIGCASGYYYEVLEYLLGRRITYTGADYSEPLIEMARDYYPGAEFVVADGAHLPFDHTFDVVISSSILLHIPNYAEHIAETARVTGSYAVAHRTPICRERATFFQRKLAYGVETVELRFNEADFLAEFELNGLTLKETFEYQSNPSQDAYEATYVFVKRAPTGSDAQ